MAIESFRETAEQIKPTSDNGLSLATLSLNDVRQMSAGRTDSSSLPSLSLTGFDTTEQLAARPSRTQGRPRPVPIQEPADDLPDWPAI